MYSEYEYDVYISVYMPYFESQQVIQNLPKSPKFQVPKRSPCRGQPARSPVPREATSTTAPSEGRSPGSPGTRGAARAQQLVGSAATNGTRGGCGMAVICCDGC